MNTLSRNLTGIITSLIGIILLSFPFIMDKKGFIFWVYGLPLLIIGILIVLNKKEDQIEQIKTKRRLKK